MLMLVVITITIFLGVNVRISAQSCSVRASDTTFTVLRPRINVTAPIHDRDCRILGRRIEGPKTLHPEPEWGTVSHKPQTRRAKLERSRTLQSKKTLKPITETKLCTDWSLEDHRSYSQWWGFRSHFLDRELAADTLIHLASRLARSFFLKQRASSVLS